MKHYHIFVLTNTKYCVYPPTESNYIQGKKLHFWVLSFKFLNRTKDDLSSWMSRKTHLRYGRDNIATETGKHKGR